VQPTTALHRAKVSGADATDTIAALDADPAPHVIIDIGCGRGTATVRLARQYPSAAILAIDQSLALLTVVRDRLPAQHTRAARSFQRKNNVKDSVIRQSLGEGR
jgi:trans-aconitate methyltransferase